MRLTKWLEACGIHCETDRQSARASRSRRGHPIATKPAAVVETLEQRSLPTIITVTSLADTVADDGQVTLREALQAANTDSTVDGATGNGTDTIRFDPALTASGPAKIVLNGTHLVISSNLTIDGPGAKNLTIDAQARSRIFAIDDSTTSMRTIAINGLTLTKGQTSEGGGAISNSEDLTLTKVVITNSIAAVGGGIATDGRLTVDRTVIAHNSASGSGGGIFKGSSAGGITIKLSTIRDNTAGANGGGIDAFSGILVSNSTITRNVAAMNGGGIRSHYSLPVVIRNSTVSNNSAGRDGGGLSDTGGQLRVLWSTISNNTAERNGGGIHSASLRNTRIIQSTLSGNSAQESGGGIFAHAGPQRRLVILQSTISGNSADNGGGLATQADVPVFNSRGDAIGRESNDRNIWLVILVLQNSIVAGNSGATGPSDLANVRPDNATAPFGTTLSQCRDNLIGDPDSVMGFGSPSSERRLYDGVYGNIVGQSDGAGGRTVIPISSILETTLKNNGGRTETLALVSNSPAIDAGRAIAGLTVDARGIGFPRKIGPRVDIGAVEFSS